MPVELLGEIFAWTLGDWGMMTDEEPSLVLEPLTISHVCAHWRAISTSIPMLWATLWIDRPRAAHVSMVALWIERSRNYPLSLYIRQTDSKSCLSHPTSTEHDLTDEILALLIPHAHRWHAVDFDFRTDAQKSLLALPVDVAVILEHVSLNVNSWDATSAESIQSMLYSYPSLRSAHFAIASKQPDLAVWKRLTHLDAEPECTWETCLDILASCTTLYSAKFRCSAVPDWPQTSFEQHLTLPTLLDLCVIASRIDLTPLFDRLTLPALHALTLDYRHVPRALTDGVALHNLLSRSACTLGAFSLHETSRMRRDDSHYISFLESPHMVSLRDLELHVDMTERIIECLTYDPTDAQTRFPNLSYLALRDGRWGEHVAEDKVATMLGSRFPRLGAADLQLRLAGHECPVLPASDKFELRFELVKCLCK
ncbi:hypothetical protein FB45DRAFT_890745 [Roridomyces roridus]|uniref:F-box domain-containing protein n=1 Tax=Roridomyces roridus TaxID=1738132 RepID=A0AAD7FZP7_9AGAR|nr:hypothetical protein FB45DRAFT_890745 [Roridomyces roridus]